MEPDRTAEVVKLMLEGLLAWRQGDTKAADEHFAEAKKLMDEE